MLVLGLGFGLDLRGLVSAEKVKAKIMADCMTVVHLQNSPFTPVD